MLKSCSACGKIHDSKYICPQKAQRIKDRQSYRRMENKKIYDFHRSQRWTDKSLTIRQRDNYCCQICLRNMYGAERQYETEDVSVHHINPLSDCWDERLDDGNLITLCRIHHEMAEKGEICKEELRAIAEEQEQKTEAPSCG